MNKNLTTKKVCRKNKKSIFTSTLGKNLKHDLKVSSLQVMESRVSITLAADREVSRYSLQELISSTNKTIVQLAIESTKSGPRNVLIKRYLLSMNQKTLVEQYSGVLTLLGQCDHINVVRIYNCFFCYYNGSFQFWIVMEYCTQHDLLTYLNKSGVNGLSESIMFFICDLSYAVEYLTKTLNIYQLSLSPDNLLLTRDPSSPIPLLKIANIFTLNDDVEEFYFRNCFYNPPEYQNKVLYENSVIWSLGVVFYMLVFGKHPLDDGKSDLLKNVLNKKKVCFTNIDDDFFKDLLYRMLVYDPTKRICLDEFFSHPFIEKCRKFKWGKESDPSIYKPLKIVGKGSYGTVIYGVRQIHSDTTPVAIKEIPDMGRDSIIREARIMRMCKHPNLVDYYDFFELNYSICEGGKPGKYSYLVMEYCDLGTLETYLHNKKRPLQNFEILHFLAEICNGLWYLHFNKKLLHRDLKLDNFLLKTPNQTNQQLPRLKITDYGFSRMFGTESQLISSYLGTPIYASPEILKKSEYTVKSDLYSVGVILFVLATNTFPFGDDKDGFYEKMQNQSPINFPSHVQIDSELKDLILKLITHNEDDRCSWQEFFEHPYVLRAVPKNSLPSHNDFLQLKNQEMDIC